MPQVEIEGIPETLDFPDDTPQEVISGTVNSLLQSRTKTETAAVSPPQQTAMEHAKATIASLTHAPGTSAVEKLGQFAQKPIFTVAPWVKPLIEKSPGMALVRATFGDESAKGIEDFMLGQGKFFATPVGILTLGVGGLSATVQKVVAGAFVGQMAASLPQDYKALQEAAESGDVRKATEIIATGATKLGLIGAVGAKAFSKEAAIDEKIAPVAPATATALKDTISVAEKEGPSATTERTQPTGDLVEHQPVSEGGVSGEASSRDQLQQGGEVPKTEEVTTPLFGGTLEMKEPPVPEGMIRLYRGETGEPPTYSEAAGKVVAPEEFRGRWFTPDKNYALSYAFGKEKFPKGAKVGYIDVPADTDLNQFKPPGLLEKNAPLGKELIVPESEASKVKYAPITPTEPAPEAVGAVKEGEPSKAQAAAEQPYVETRIRSDLPEAKPIIDRIDAIVAQGEKRRSEMHEGQTKDLTHPSDLLTFSEKEELHSLKLMLREKTPAEARADLAKKRAARLKPKETPSGTSVGMEPVGAATPEDVGRKGEIEQLTDAFKGAEGKKVPLTEQVKQAFDVGEKLSKAKDAVGNALEALKFTGEFLVKKLDAVSDWDSIKKIKGELSAEIEAGGWRLRKFEKAVKRAFSDPKERAAISNWIEHDGDSASLTKAMNETAPEFRQSYQDALNLSDDAKVAARNVKNYFESVLQEAIDAGVIDHGIEDYLHRVYQKDTPARQQLLARVQSGILNTRKPGLAMKRLFEMDIDAEKAGLKPVKDFLPRILDYETSLRRAIASRAAVKKFTEVTMPDGRPMLSVKGIGIPVGDPAGVREATLIRPKLAQHDPNKPGYNGDYVDRNYPALRKWKWVSQDADGKPIFLQGDVSIHPDAVRRMDQLLEPSRVGRFGKGVLTASTTVKQTMLDLSGFHHVQVTLHGLEHQVNPFRLLQDINFEDPNIMGLLKGGVTLGGEYRVGELSEGVVGRSLTRQIPGLGPLMETYHAWLFQDYIPRLKMTMATHALERNRIRFAEDLKSGKMTEEQLFYRTAKEANAAFGEQNYTVMERSKTARDIARLTLMAPDFLESRIKFAAQALQKGGKTKLGALTANEQRQALLLGAVTMYITARIANKALSGQYRMEPENAFSLVVNGKAYSLRTVQGDIMHFLTKPAQFWLTRLNPLTTRPILEAVTGRDSFGRKRSGLEQAWDFVSTVQPISTRTSAERKLWESMSSAFGLNVRRFSEVDAAYKLAQKWKQENNVVERGEFIYDPEKDALRPLKIALSESDDAAAVKAIRNLIESKQYTQKKLFDYFKTYANRPFTGSKANDTKWVSGLSEEDKKTVEVARQYRRRMFELYQSAADKASGALVIYGTPKPE